jgi:hypothetical protein
MITPVDDSVARRLVLARDALMEAQRLANYSQVDLNLMRAVWQADFALELALPAFYDHNGWTHPLSKKAFTPGLPQYLEDLKENHIATEKLDVRLVANAENVHKSRNDVQHRGNVFHMSTAKTLIRYSKNFLEFFSSKYLNVEFERLNLSILNTDSEAQKFFDKALKYFDTEEYGQAAREIAEAYNVGYANLLFTNNDLVDRDWDSIRNRHRRSLKKQVEEIYSRSGFDLKDSYAKKALELIIQHLDLTQFGIEMNIAIHFFNLLPTVKRPVDSTKWVYAGDDREYSRDEIEFLFDQSLLIL